MLGMRDISPQDGGKLMKVSENVLRVFPGVSLMIPQIGLRHVKNVLQENTLQLRVVSVVTIVFVTRMLKTALQNAQHVILVRLPD
jgi:hypothetical protein